MVKIPLPTLATQQAIVAEIEAEQALVVANRELITRFEQKIQATLARIWGEDGAKIAPGNIVVLPEEPEELARVAEESPSYQ
ncbi:MAG: hypothetical protein H0X34_10280 [Chthoniobacterales bacterium]|nr:hypothetical protein [Chthoniobacterales bacterium]